MIYDIDGNVPDDQVELIKQGLALAQNYFDSKQGGGIPSSVSAGIHVKIVATGLGNTEEGGGGGVATAFSDGKIRPFFDTAHPQWIQHLDGFGITAETNILHSVAHEWAHGWQSWLGALDNYHQPLGDAFNEGIAEYLSYSVLVDADILTWDVVNPFMLGSADRSDELDGEIRDLESTHSIWLGHAGFLAIQWLVGDAPSGDMALRTLATEIGRGESIPDAFRTAFNIELDDFYTQFEAWRVLIEQDPDHGYANRPELINIGEHTPGATPGADIIDGTPGINVYAGLGGDDQISGRGGNDKLYGNEDNDTLIGGAGKDKLDGGIGRDAASYADATKKVLVSLLSPNDNKGDAKGDSFHNIEDLIGSGFSDRLSGDKADNHLAGGKGNDTLAGGKGHDVLEGGAGKDVFLFDTSTKAADADTITGFRPKDDTIQLDHDVFATLSVGALPKGAFAANGSGKAQDADDRVIYEQDSGKLFYDTNGNKHGHAVLIATLDTHLHLKAADFEIV